MKNNLFIIKKRKIFFLLIILFISKNIYSQSSWFWQQPLPQGNSLCAINFADSNNGVAIGAYGTIVRTTDCGETWYLLNNIVKNNLYSVCFTGNNDGFICGSSGLLLKTRNAGASWSKINIDVYGNFNKIQFSSKNTGWIIGEKGTILKTTDGGDTWLSQSSNTSYDLLSLSVYDSNTCIIMGEKRFMIKTTDSGKNWIKLDSISSVKYSNPAICFKTKDTIYASGIEKFIYTTNGGNQWQIGVNHDLVTCDMLIFNDIVHIAGYEALTCGSAFTEKKQNYNYFNHKILSGQNSSICESEFLGAVQYYDQKSNFWYYKLRRTLTIIGMTSIKNKILFAVGDRGVIYKQGSLKVPFIKDYIYDVHLFDENNGIICGKDGVLLKTNDGGKNWISRKIDSATYFERLAFSGNAEGKDNGKCFMIANYSQKQKLLVTTDYGNTWNISAADRQGISDVHFCNNSYGVAAGNNGFIMITTDGGNTWSNQNVPNVHHFYSVYALDSLFITAVGTYGKICQTKDGGKTWSTHFIDSTSTLRGVWFTDSKNGFIIGYLTNGQGGIILRTTDGGEQWKKLNPNTIPDLSRIYFTDQNHGYIIGGTYMYTTNGGYDWIEDPTIMGTSIHFANRDIGTIISISGSILRTTTGGMTSIPENPKSNIPTSIKLLQNYPNPFNPVTVISYFVETQGIASVQIKVYDILGREIKTLVNENQQMGEHKVEFDGNNLPSGIYFYRITNGNQALTRKMLLLK
jgi:photosystem II stability/assembly factor-like uncharacterized protein